MVLFLPLIKFQMLISLGLCSAAIVPATSPLLPNSRWQPDLIIALDRTQPANSDAYRQQVLLMGLGFMLLAIGLSLALRWLSRQLNRHGASQTLVTSWVAHWSVKTLLRPGLLLLQIAAWLAALVYFTELFPFSRSWRYQAQDFLEKVLTDPIFILGTTSYSILDLLKILVLAIGLWIAVRIITVLVRSRLLQSIGADREIQNAIALSIQFILMGIGLIIILQGLGFDVSSLALLASVLGVGIGFGLQNIANNFVSGLIILLERQIRVGDFVRVGDLTGSVEHIGVRSTEIRTLDSVTIIVPNSELVETKVVNWSHGHPVSRLHLPFGVAYGSNVRQVRACVFEAVQVHPDVLRYPQPQIWFERFGDSALDFDLLVWIQEPRQQFRIRSDLYYLIESNLRRYKIEVPYSQHDIYLRSPQVEQWLQLWQRYQRDSDAAWGEPLSVNDLQPQAPATNISPCAAHVDELLAELREYSAELQHQGDLSDREIAQIVEQMRSPDGVEIKDRRYGLKVYPRCFIGNEAVRWLMRNQKATREEAVRIGQMLVDRTIIHHVLDEHGFEDQFLFYQFYEDEEG